MTIFYWNKSFELGIPEIDHQHRRLVDLINELAVAITDGSKLPDVRLMIDRLMEYATNHFMEEEVVLMASALPEAEKTRHKQAHQSFVAKTQEIAQRSDLLRSEISEQVLEFLTTWLVSHILGSDKKIVAALDASKAIAGEMERLFDISPVERTLLGALTETERRFRLISDHSPVLIWVSDTNGARGFFNRAWEVFLGVGLDTLADERWVDYIHPKDRPAYLELLCKQADQPNPVEVEYRLRNRSGNYHWFLEKILPRIDSNGVFLGLIASATDISSIKQAEALLTHANEELEKEVAQRTAQLEKLMLTDPLTGVGNRRFLTKSLDEEVQRAQRYERPLCVIFLDLDHFKRINDTYGHAVGDIVLTRVSQRLGACLRACDKLGRFGGEEFVALLPEASLVEAGRVAERMRIDVAQLEIPEIQGSVTVSAGLAECMPGEAVDTLLQRSDDAMYQAKAAGRNCCRTAS